MIEGNDGGACVSYNGGDTFSTIYNQLTAQFYHVTTDTQFPYRVYGNQQDNSAISVPSRSHKGAIPWGDCYAVGSSESGYIVVDPTDPKHSHIRRYRILAGAAAGICCATTIRQVRCGSSRSGRR